MDAVDLTPDPPPGPPLLWGEWRPTKDDRTFVAPCVVCGALCIISRRGFDEWRASCENGCSREAMDARAGELLAEQRARYQHEREVFGAMLDDDPFHTIDSERYVRMLTGREAKRGFVCCPFHGNGEERTPSLHVKGTLWFCHSCRRGGTIYDFAAELWGIEPRGEGFTEIKHRLAGELLKAPL